MSTGFKPPGMLRSSFIEWRARRVGDPIQKLSYLRRAARWKDPGCLPLRGSYGKTALLLLAVACSRVQIATDASPKPPQTSSVQKTAEPPATLTIPNEIWLVDKGSDYEAYSNGLRLETRFLTPNVRRAYVVFPDGASPANHSQWRSEPAGIVFHTSESPQAPFAADQNFTLTRIGRDLVRYISEKRAYHFVIDRFGRAFRVVPETDVANHAGYSVWAGADGIYLNLNHSFLGISFEAHTSELDEGCYLTPGQIRSARLLVEMLVRKYKIPSTNCVTHAQVSVSPETMVIGHHTDGSGDFPFAELGLPDNYNIPIPSLYAFGFEYDPHFLMSTGARVWKGLLLADERFRREANSQHLTAGEYRQILRERYRTSIAMLRDLGVLKEE
jgi:hypothetical protein